MNDYDLNTATVTDKAFVATMLKTITSDERITQGLASSTADYLTYVINTMVKKINAELTLDIIKTMSGSPTEDNDDE